MSEEEHEFLRNRLQTKYDNLVHQYQSKAHQKFFASEWSKKRKEDMENQIETLKKYLEKLSKPYVFIDKNGMLMNRNKTFT